MKWLVGWLLINCDGLFKKICRVGHTQRDRVGRLRQPCQVLKMITSSILNRSLSSVNCSSTDSLFPAWSYIKLIRISFLACLLKMSDFISTKLLPTHTKLLTKKQTNKNIRKYLQWTCFNKKAGQGYRGRLILVSSNWILELQLQSSNGASFLHTLQNQRPLLHLHIRLCIASNMCMKSCSNRSTYDNIWGELSITQH